MPDNTGFVRSIKEIRALTQAHKLKYPETASSLDFQLGILENQFEQYPRLDRESVENAINEILYIKNMFDENYVPDINGDPGTTPFDYAKDIAERIANFLGL